MHHLRPEDHITGENDSGDNWSWGRKTKAAANKQLKICLPSAIFEGFPRKPAFRAAGV